jgi:hypothetical protein
MALDAYSAFFLAVPISHVFGAPVALVHSSKRAAGFTLSNVSITFASELVPPRFQTVNAF